MNPWRIIGWIVLALLVLAIVAAIAGLISPSLFGFEAR